MEIPVKRSNSFTSYHNRYVESDDDSEDDITSAKQRGKMGISSTNNDEQKSALLWALLASYLPSDVKSIQKSFVHHVEYTLARGRGNVTQFGAFQALAFSVRDRLIERLKDTQIYFKEKQCKRVAYMSMEFLLGRSLQNAIVNLGLEDSYSSALRGLGIKLEELYEEEQDAGLGNGGLGRLAACFLDSLATMDYPAWGYGLRYKYGMFYQKIRDGYQVELPDYWLSIGNPWEIERQDIIYPIHFYGSLKEVEDEDGKIRVLWQPSSEVLAVAYDTPIPGYETYNTLSVRLWSARPSKEFDFETFSKGDFYSSLEEKQSCEAITAVLYPADNTEQGKELRLKQQFFLCSATIQDLVRRLKEMNKPLSEFHNYIAIQLNDTHPAIAIVELMRILVDFERLPWKQAWAVTSKTFGYTNHNVNPEVLEKWPVSLIEKLLPRHMRIIYDINHYFLQTIHEKWPGDTDKLRSLSVIEEGPIRYVRMANLAVVCSHAVNGVAELHSFLLRTQVFKDYHELFPDKFYNMTNGVTPRRWLHQANPDLSILISTFLRNTNWLFNFEMLSGLRASASSTDLHRLWSTVKRKNKVRLAEFVEQKCNIKINVDSLFDVHVKRIHEYKRQLLNILYVIHRYQLIKQMNTDQKKDVVPRTVFFGGKASPGRQNAKLIIKLIHDVAAVINSDKETNGLLKLVFIPNYCVSVAEIIIPASELSQHISTAGMEASGTSNMKFAMNGCLIISTMDGSNYELSQEVGEENMFVFGTRGHQVNEFRKKIKEGTFEPDSRFVSVLSSIESGQFGDPALHQPLVDSVKGDKDFYLISVDFPSYIEAQSIVDETYKNSALWTMKSIMNTAGMGKFSSDRAAKEYAEKIWNIKPMRRPGPVPVSLERLERTLQINSGFDTTSPTDRSFLSLERMTPKQF